MEVGDYVRTDKGYIFRYYPIKYSEYDEEDNIYHEWEPYGEYDDYYKIIKSSSNIIDLIEVGDYVNGNPVCLIKEDEHNRKWVYTDSNYKYGYLEKDIKSILTKEQFKREEYIVNENK